MIVSVRCGSDHACPRRERWPGHRGSGGERIAAIPTSGSAQLPMPPSTGTLAGFGVTPAGVCVMRASKDIEPVSRQTQKAVRTRFPRPRGPFLGQVTTNRVIAHTRHVVEKIEDVSVRKSATGTCVCRADGAVGTTIGVPKRSDSITRTSAGAKSMVIRAWASNRHSCCRACPRRSHPRARPFPHSRAATLNDHEILLVEPRSRPATASAGGSTRWSCAGGRRVPGYNR